MIYLPTRLPTATTAETAKAVLDALFNDVGIATTYNQTDQWLLREGPVPHYQMIVVPVQALTMAIDEPKKSKSTSWQGVNPELVNSRDPSPASGARVEGTPSTVLSFFVDLLVASNGFAKGINADIRLSKHLDGSPSEERDIYNAILAPFAGQPVVDRPTADEVKQIDDGQPVRESTPERTYMNVSIASDIKWRQRWYS